MSNHKVCEICGDLFFYKITKKGEPKCCSAACLGQSGYLEKKVVPKDIFWEHLSRKEKLDIIEKEFMNKVVISPDSCWYWKGPKKNTVPRYLLLKFRGNDYGARRLSWILFNGNIPGGMGVSSICKQEMCVNPAHLSLKYRYLRDNVREEKLYKIKD